MKRKDRLEIAIFITLVLLIFFIVLLNYNFFKDIIKQYVGIYGYYALPVATFFTDLIEQPIGPEIPSGFAAFFGLNVLLIFLLAVAGSFVASMINYYVGKFYLSEKIINSCKIGTHNKWCKFFNKYGGLALFLAATTPVPYVAFCWLSGAFHMKLKHYFLYGLLPRAFRIGIFILLGGYLNIAFIYPS